MKQRGWTPEPVWILCGGQRSLVPAGNPTQIPRSPIPQPVHVPTVLPKFLFYHDSLSRQILILNSVPNVRLLLIPFGPLHSDCCSTTRWLQQTLNFLKYYLHSTDFVFCMYLMLVLRKWPPPSQRQKLCHSFLGEAPQGYCESCAEGYIVSSSSLNRQLLSPCTAFSLSHFMIVLVVPCDNVIKWQRYEVTIQYALS